MNKGYVRQYREGKWSYSISLGRENGKRKRKEVCGFSSKAEAEAALAIKLAELATTGDVFVPTNMTVSEVFSLFIESARITRRETTIYKHNMIHDVHLKPKLGFRLIKSVKAKDIDEFTSSLIKEGYSENYIQSITKTLYCVFAYAVEYGLLKENVMYKAARLKPKTKEVDIYTEEEISLVLNTLCDTPYLPMVMISLYCGLRIAEACALRWRDVDLEAGVIKVNKQMLCQPTRIALGPPKTASSVRNVEMPATLTTYLRWLKESRALTLTNNQGGNIVTMFDYNTNKTLEIDDFVNVRDDGSMISPYATKTIKRMLKRVGIVWKSHTLRHTHASQLLERGATIKYVQMRLGHASPTVTLNTYSHFTKQHSESVLASLSASDTVSDKLFSGVQVAGSDQVSQLETTQ